MPLAAGTRLGPYEIVAPIGSGGMGEVYRARDTRLERDVAIKVLPEAVAQDVDLRARFDRETKAVAALSHPNVVAIYDTGIHDGRLFAVTELLVGATLRERLRHGKIAPHKAIDWAVQIARGLSAAHDKQLVHRDLKPENIFVLEDGHVKILDFGLARQVPDAGGATQSVDVLTNAGTVLGTVGYMAPEQVRGQSADARADLFSFGAVLYEILTQQRAFRRDTAAETMTAILNDEPPDVAGLRADLPPGLSRIVRHCLEKAPQERFQSARDVAFALESLSDAGTEASRKPASGATPAGGAELKRVVFLAGIVVAGLAAGWFAMKTWWKPAESSPAAAVTIGAASQLTTEDGLEIDPALSPDGKLLAYAAGTATRMRLYIRPVAGGRVITLSETGAALELRPRWSPDSSQILFRTDEGVFVASALGGTARRIVSGKTNSAAWAPDGKRIVVARPGDGRTGDLSIAAIDGSSETPIAKGGYEVHSCDWSRRNDWIACVSGNLTAITPGQGFGNIAPSAIVIAPVSGGALINVTDRVASNLSPVWSPDGRQLYFVSSKDGPRDVYVVKIGDKGQVEGAPGRITTGLGVLSIAFSGDARQMVYVAYTARANVWSLPIPATGMADAARAVALTNGSQVVESMRVSPDREWVVYDSTLKLNADIFRMRLSGESAEQLTSDSADEFAPDMSPDGRTVVFHSWTSGSRDIYVKSIDGGAARALTATPGQESYPRWSPDGKSLTYVDQRTFDSIIGVTGDLYLMQQTESGAWSSPRRLMSGVATRGVWQRDGAAVIYMHETGIKSIPIDGSTPRTVYAPAPGTTDPLTLSVELSDDGRTVYFKSVDADSRSTIWAVPVSGGRPQLLVRFGDPARASIRPDFAVGAGRFFFTFEERQADIWMAEIQRK